MSNELTPDLTHESVNGELVVFDPETQQVHLLNDRAANSYLDMDVPSRRRFLQATAVVGGAAVATMVLPSLSAAASTISGGSLTPGPGAGTYGDSGFTPNFVVASSPVAYVEQGAPYIITGAGSVTSWSTRGFGGKAALLIARPTGTAGQYTVIYSGAIQTLPSSSAVSTFTLPSPVQVLAGDHVGSWANAGSTFYRSTGTATDIGDVDYPAAPPAAGATITTTPDAQSYRNSISVTVF